MLGEVTRERLSLEIWKLRFHRSLYKELNEKEITNGESKDPESNEYIPREIDWD